MQNNPSISKIGKLWEKENHKRIYVFRIEKEHFGNNKKEYVNCNST